jgi:hypothetical protein
MWLLLRCAQYLGCAETVPLSQRLAELVSRITALKAKEKGLFVTLYAKSTYKMPRQHTSNPKIPKVSQAIGSPFY